MLCDLCGENETGRVIEGKAVCDRCFIEGQYNLPENRAKLAEPEVYVSDKPKKPKKKGR